MKELTINELINIAGGKPSEKTSFGYDVAWCITKAVKWVVDLF